jgi:hypothetical protein
MERDERPNAQECWRCNSCKKIPKEEDVPKILAGGLCPVCFFAKKGLED